MRVAILLAGRSALGSNIKGSAPFHCVDLAVQPPRELAALYRRASAGVVFSLTTHSLVAQEMMASDNSTQEPAGRSYGHGKKSIFRRHVRKHRDSIGQAFQARRAKCGSIQHLFAALREGPQAGDEIPAIDAGYVARQKRL